MDERLIAGLQNLPHQFEPGLRFELVLTVVKRIIVLHRPTVRDMIRESTATTGNDRRREATIVFAVRSEAPATRAGKRSGSW